MTVAETLRRFLILHWRDSESFISSITTKVLTYGNLPLEEHLKLVDGKLSLIERIKIDTELKKPIIDGPMEVRVVDPLMERAH